MVRCSASLAVGRGPAMTLVHHFLLRREDYAQRLDKPSALGSLTVNRLQVTVTINGASPALFPFKALAAASQLHQIVNPCGVKRIIGNSDHLTIRWMALSIEFSENGLLHFVCGPRGVPQVIKRGPVAKSA